MKKIVFLLLPIIFIITLISSLAWLIHWDSCNTEEKRSYIGKNVIINHDTLKVMDWNKQNGFTLSSGVKADEDFIMKIAQ